MLLGETEPTTGPDGEQLKGLLVREYRAAFFGEMDKEFWAPLLSAMPRH